MATLCSGFGLLEGPVWDPARGLLFADGSRRSTSLNSAVCEWKTFPGSDLKEGVRAFLEKRAPSFS